MDLCCERNCEVFIVAHNLVNKLEEKTFIQNCYNKSFSNQVTTKLKRVSDLTEVI